MKSGRPTSVVQFFHHLPLCVGKEKIEFELDPSAGVDGLKPLLQARSGVPSERMKVMPKSIKDTEDLVSSCDWRLASPTCNDVYRRDVYPPPIACCQSNLFSLMKNYQKFKFSAIKVINFSRNERRLVIE